MRDWLWHIGTCVWRTFRWLICWQPRNMGLSRVWRRVWIAVKIGSRTWGWWPADWRRSFSEVDPPNCDRLAMGVLIGVSND